MSGLTAISGEAAGDARKPVVNITHPWPEPEPLVTFPKPVPYPLDALHDIIQGAVREVQSFVQAPLPMIATSALGTLSLATQGLVDIQRAETLSGPTSLFTLTIAESGERKSTVDKYFTGEIRRYESEQGEALRPALRVFQTEKRVWEAKQQGLLDKIKSATKTGKPTESPENELHALGLDRPKAVKAPHLIRSDETPEHLAMALRDDWPSGGIVSSEAGTVFGSHGMNNESVMRALSQLNLLWDGGELQIGRVTRDSFRLRDVRLTVSLQVRDIKDAASKVADNIARVAALLHVFEDSPTTSVTIESVRAAHRIVAWHIRESRRFLGSFSPPEALAKAMVLEGWMVAYCKSNGVTSLTTTVIGQKAPHAVRRKKEFDPILNTLSEHHRCRLDQDGLTRRVTINPALVEGE